MKKILLPVMLGCLGLTPALQFSQILTATAAPLVAQTPTNSVEKAESLLLQASQLIATGQTNKGAEILAQIVQLAPSLPQESAANPDMTGRSNILFQVASKYAEIGQFEQALKIANTIQFDLWKINAQQAIAYAYLDRGQESQALEIINQITDKFERVRSLREVAARYLTAGRQSLAGITIDRALEITQTIPAGETSKYVGFTKDNLLSWLAGDYAQMEQYAKAEAIANTIQDQYSKAEAQDLIVRGYLEKGLLDRALQYSKTIGNADRQVQVLREVARKYAQTGDRTKAGQALNQAFELAKANDNGYGSFSIADYAGAYAEIGLYDRAMQLLSSLEDDYSKADGRRAIAKAYFNTGDYAKALEMAKPIPNGILMPVPEYGDPKVELLQDISLKAAQTAQYDVALAAVKALYDGEDRVWALRRIAKEYAKVGQKDKAAETLAQALDVANKTEKVLIYAERTGTYLYASNARLISDIASEYAAIGQKAIATDVMKLALKQAQTDDKVATQFSSNWSDGAITKLQTLNQIVEQSLTMGFQDKVEQALSQALQMVPTLEGNANRLQVLAGVVGASGSTSATATQILTQALPLAQKLDNPGDKVTTQAKIATAFAQIGKKERAGEILAQVLPGVSNIQADPNSGTTVNYKRAYAVSEIATAYAYAAQPEQALKVANSIEVADIKRVAIASLVQAYAKSGQLQLAQAVPLAQDIQDRQARSLALTELAQAYLAKGEPVQALPVAQIIAEDDKKAKTLAQVALALAKAGQAKAALPILTQVSQLAKNDFFSKADRAAILGDVAIAYAASGEQQQARVTLNQALQVAKTVDFQGYPADSMLSIIASAIKAGQEDLAVQVIPALPGDRFKIAAWRQIAQLYQASGKRDKAGVALTQASQVASTLPDLAYRQQLLNAIAQQQQGLTARN